MSAAAPPAGLIIRATEPDDAPALNAIANLPGVRWGTTLPAFLPLAQTRQWLQQPFNGVRIVAVLEGEVVGSTDFRRLEARSAHVADIGLSVHDAHTGRGIGRALLDALIDAAENWHGLRRLQLLVYTDNTPAIRLYERLGFVREGVLRARAFRAGRDEDLLLMARLRGEGRGNTAG